ncbi:hypothetical protein C8R43DRAFT_1236289, partial [Mycena crocata]
MIPTKPTKYSGHLQSDATAWMRRTVLELCFTQRRMYAQWDDAQAPLAKRGPKNSDAELQELKHQVSALAAELRHVPPPTDASGLSSVPPSLPSDKSRPASRATSQHANHSGECSLVAIDTNEDAIQSNEDQVENVTERFNAFSDAIAAKEEHLGHPSKPEWKRPEYWVTRPWEQRSIASESPPQYNFPDADLLLLYIENVHPTLPLLHRPLFERNVKEELHLRDHQFGALLLAVLVLASRVSGTLLQVAQVSRSDGRVPRPVGDAYTMYSQLQITIHRPYIHTPMMLPFPSWRLARTQHAPR